VRRASKVDTTHVAIREALRQRYGAGAVLDTHGCGDDFPDLVVGVEGVTLLIECKTASNLRGGFRQDKAAKQLQRAAIWPGGPWLFVVGPEQAIAAVDLALQLRRGALGSERHRGL
jgi:Holliday junction resolvase